MANTTFTSTTRIACNPAGTGRTVPGKCVHVALQAIGTGCTVAEYEARMAKWHKAHPAPHMAYPGGGSAMGLLRYLVDTNHKVVVVASKAKAPRKARAPKVAPVVAPQPASQP
jgi:hypothetical protein